MNQHDRVINLLNELELDGVLISNGYNMRYLSGFSGATGYLFITRQRRIIMTDFRYTNQVVQETEGFEIVELLHNYHDHINELLLSEDIKRLGFEAKDLFYADYLKLKQFLQVEQLIPIQDEITSLRSVKSEEELSLIRKAEEIGDIAFKQILDFIKPGVTELEIAAKLQYIMLTNDAEGLSFDTIVASGIHSSMPHASPTNKKIESGDFITMDFGCVYHGYCSDMTRTIVMGKASEKQKKIYNTVLSAQLAALDFIKAGYKGKEIDAVARNYIDSSGYKGCFGHGLGHSVGLYIHENPRLSINEDSIILANTIQTVEPGIYIKDFGGVRIEDLVVVTQDGHINYTHSDKKLIEL